MSQEVGRNGISSVDTRIDYEALTVREAQPHQFLRVDGIQDQSLVEQAAAFGEISFGDTLATTGAQVDLKHVLTPDEQSLRSGHGKSGDVVSRQWNGARVGRGEQGRGPQGPQEKIRHEDAIVRKEAQDMVDDLKGLLAGQDQAMELDQAALNLATVEFRDLDFGPSLLALDRFANDIAERCSDLSDGREFVRIANAYLFQEVGLRGNADDYYNPRNSCLNQVLDGRLGIPISLSVVYIEIGRRLAKHVVGIGLPRHFVIQYDDGDYATYIDPFPGGALLSREDCFRLAQVEEDNPRLLAPACKRQIVMRMINNLRGIYFSQRSFEKAQEILNVLIEANPNSAEEYKQRGLVRLQMRRLLDGKSDLQKYLALNPEAEDKEEIQGQLHAVGKWLAALN
jgi:regulator of sirC expression with transglutaminase-like and TPR domain